jgi:hypothetical protein
VIGVAVVIVLATALHLAGATEAAAALLLVFATWRLWRYHRSAGRREAEFETIEAEEAAVQAEEERMLSMLRHARERRRSEAETTIIEPKSAAGAIHRMIRGREEP